MQVNEATRQPPDLFLTHLCQSALVGIITWQSHQYQQQAAQKTSKGFRRHSNASTSWIEQGKPFSPWATSICQHVNAFNEHHERLALLWHLLYKTGQAGCCDGHFLQIAFVLLIFLRPLLFSIHNCKPQRWFGQNWTPPLKKRKTNMNNFIVSKQRLSRPQRATSSSKPLQRSPFAILIWKVAIRTVVAHKAEQKWNQSLEAEFCRFY